MYIATMPNRGSPPALLLREGYREGGKVKHHTQANLSHWPAEKVELLRRVLRGDRLTPVDSLVGVVASPHHGHVQAVRLAMRRLGFEPLIASRPSRERAIAVAMIVARILEPDSKLATTRWWHTTTLPAELGVRDADEDDLYVAMDWLLARQARIERKLAARHLREGGLVLYDLTSSYFEGTTCPLAAFGHDRDGKKGKLQVTYGLLTAARGCPVAVSVFPGNTGDPKTLLPEVEWVRADFGIEHLVLVGDRGLMSVVTLIDGLGIAIIDGPESPIWPADASPSTEDGGLPERRRRLTLLEFRAAWVSGDHEDSGAPRGCVAPASPIVTPGFKSVSSCAVAGWPMRRAWQAGTVPSSFVRIGATIGNHWDFRDHVI